MPATFELLVLSSSPPGATSPRFATPRTPPNGQGQRASMATFSPIRLQESEGKRSNSGGALKSGSRAAAIPDGASRGFATAAELVRSHHFNLDNEVAAEETQVPQARNDSIESQEKKLVKKPRKRATKTDDAVATGDPQAKKPRARRLKKDGAQSTATATKSSHSVAVSTSSYFLNAESAPSKAPTTLPQAIDTTSDKPKKPTKPRKARTKKDEQAEVDLTGEKPKETRTRRPKEVAHAVNKGRRKSTGEVSGHFVTEQAESTLSRRAEVKDSEDEAEQIWDVLDSPKPAIDRPKKRRPPDKPPEPLDLDDAVTRRRDWTPPRDTEFAVHTNPTDSSVDCLATEPPRDPFNGGLLDFAYTQPQPQPQPHPAPVQEHLENHETAGMRKRRIEMVKLPSNLAPSKIRSPDKVKATKKKPRTITDLVTGQYAPKFDQLPPEDVSSAFFAPNTSTTKIPLNDVSNSAAGNAPTKPTRKRSTSKSSEKDNKKSKKTNTKIPPKPKMLAEKLLSPASALSRLNRQDILFGTSSQLALEESPTMIRQLQEAMRQSEVDSHSLPGASRIGKDGASPLWPRLSKLAGMRGLWAASTRDQDGELLDRQPDVYLPEPDRTQDIPLLMDGTADDPMPLCRKDDGAPDAVVISSDLPTPPETIPDEPVADEQCAEVIQNSFEDIDDFDYQLPPSGQQAQSSFLDIDDFSPEQPLSSTMPPKVALTGSPKRRRGRPPKAASAIPPRLQKTTSAPPKLPSPKKSRTTVVLPKTPPTSSRFPDIEEILDSENDEAFSPTPPRLSRLPDSAPLLFDRPLNEPLEAASELTPVFKVHVSQLPWAGIKASIFQQISTTIRSLPPSQDLQKPSWHEKILMYDAIILEDFTTFLNADTSIRTWRRATQKQIKAWNRHLKGTGEAQLEIEGGQEEPEEVFVVQKELEPYMAQAWCQEMSICCIYKKGIGRDGARKGLY